MKKAVVLIVTDTSGRVLLLKRGEGHKHFPGQWCLPGGKVDYKAEWITYTDPTFASTKMMVYEWESDDEACIRECIEETGYIPSLIQNTHITAVGSDKEFIVKVFRCLDTIPYKTGGDYSHFITREFPNGEHVEYGFFEVSNLPREIGTLTNKIINQIL